MLLHHAEWIGHGVLVGIVPKIVENEAVFGEVLFEWCEHVIGRWSFPIRLQFARQREGRDQLGAGTWNRYETEAAMSRMSPFCHCAFDEVIRTGILRAFATRASPTTLLLYSAMEVKSRTPAIRPIW